MMPVRKNLKMTTNFDTKAFSQKFKEQDRFMWSSKALLLSPW